MNVLVKATVGLATIVIKAIFLKRERKDLDFERAPRKERRQVTRQLEGFRPGNEYVILLRCVETIDCPLETIAHLNLIDK